MVRAHFVLRVANIVVPLALLGRAAAPAADSRPPERIDPQEPIDLRALFEQGIPPSPYANVAYRYADTLLEPAPTVAGRDQSFLRLLFLLAELSGEAKYREAAEGALRSQIERVASGEPPGAPPKDPSQGPSVEPVLPTPWVLLGRCFELSPQAARRFALAIEGRRLETPREKGFALRIAADAYGATADPGFLRAIERILDETIPLRPDEVASRLSFAIDCDGAARKVPGPLCSRLQAIATLEDRRFCSLPHDLAHGRGFALGGFALGGAVEGNSPRRSTLWGGAEGVGERAETTARIGMMCVARYENTGNVAYRELVLGAAEAYLGVLPPEGAGTRPETLGQAISLELAAFRETARDEFHRSARRLADFAIERLYGASSIPLASLATERRDASSGAATLALALVELHLLTRHITAVRAPANTIDR